MIRALRMLTGVQIILQDILRMHTHQLSCCLYYHHKELTSSTSVEEGPQQEDKTSG